MQTNVVIVQGRLTRDPEYAQTAGGTSICKLGIANNENYTKNGEKVEHVNFFDVTVFGKTADICHGHLRKGAMILVEGNLRYESWTTNEGQKRSAVKITGRLVNFLSKPEAKPDAPGQPSPAPAAPPRPPLPSDPAGVFPDDDNMPF